MRELIEYLVKLIIQEEESVSVEDLSNSSNPSLYHLKISLPKEHVGRIIGKNGSVIKSLRQLASIQALKEGKHLQLDIAELNL